MCRRNNRLLPKKSEGREAYRIKSGNYRVIYEIDDKAKIVYVLSVRDRKDAYKKR